MAYFEEGSEAMVALERMVDHVGLRNVLYALASICGAKAQHLQSNWQDDVAAKYWDRDALKITSVAGRIVHGGDERATRLG